MFVHKKWMRRGLKTTVKQVESSRGSGKKLYWEKQITEGSEFPAWVSEESALPIRSAGFNLLIVWKKSSSKKVLRETFARSVEQVMLKDFGFYVKIFRFSREGLNLLQGSSKSVSWSDKGGGVEDPPCSKIDYSEPRGAESREGSSTLAESVWVFFDTRFWLAEEVLVFFRARFWLAADKNSVLG